MASRSGDSGHPLLGDCQWSRLETLGQVEANAVLDPDLGGVADSEEFPEAAMATSSGVITQPEITMIVIEEDEDEDEEEEEEDDDDEKTWKTWLGRRTGMSVPRDHPWLFLNYRPDRRCCRPRCSTQTQPTTSTSRT